MRTLMSGITVAVVCASPSAASGQERPVEFGVDASVSYVRYSQPDFFGTDTETVGVTRLILPESAFRLGFWLGDRTALDLSTQVSVAHAGGEDSTTGWSVRLVPGLARYFPSSDSDRMPYVRVDGGAAFQDTSESDSATSWLLGGAAGLRLPVGEHVFVRVEGGYQHMFGGDDVPEANVFRFGTGLSATIN